MIQVRDETGARIIFPAEGDADKETIVLIGKKEDAEKAQKILQDKIKSMVWSGRIMSWTLVANSTILQ